MRVKWKTTVNKIPQMTRTLETLSKKKIEVGAIQGEHAWLAAIHEYGCEITVTPKMRAFLHYQGLHLKDTTKVIKIPERSFLRKSHDEKGEQVLKQAERALPLVIHGQMTVEQYMDMVGRNYVTMIKEFIVELDSPPNHPYTVEQKGSSNPLVDTGGLVESISYRVK